MKARYLLIVIVLTALFSACAAGGASQATPTAEGGNMPVVGRTSALPSKITQPIELAVKELTDRLGISADDVELISVTTEEMPLSDLGCPAPGAKPGTAQPDGIVLGKEVTLKAGGKTYVYRVYRLRTALCEETLPVKTTAPSLPEASEVALEVAMDDLAARLKVDRGAIQIASVEKRMWSDTSLGCPQPGMMYAQVITPGFLIQLTAGGKTYTYHASLTSAVLCEK